MSQRAIDSAGLPPSQSLRERTCVDTISPRCFMSSADRIPRRSQIPGRHSRVMKWSIYSESQIETVVKAGYAAACSCVVGSPQAGNAVALVSLQAAMALSLVYKD